MIKPMASGRKAIRHWKTAVPVGHSKRRPLISTQTLFYPFLKIPMENGDIRRYSVKRIVRTGNPIRASPSLFGGLSRFSRLGTRLLPKTHGGTGVLVRIPK
jgi:hypothetical protein